MSTMRAIGDLLGGVVRRRSGAQPAGRRTDRGTKRRRKARAAKLEADAVVRVEYTPRVDGDPDPGEVVWAWVPYEEDPDQGKDRPVVIVGRVRGSLVGVPLTSKRNDEEAQVAIGTGQWDSELRPSYARIWRMLTLDPSAMRREGAALARDRFDAVVAAIDEYYDVAGG